MSNPQKPQNYRDVIDALVDMCQNGQGQVGVRRVREGVWNKNAVHDSIPEQHQIDLLLERLSTSEREVLAVLLTRSVETGAFEALKILEQFAIAPFSDGYEGSPYHDFAGRLNGWSWPEDGMK